MSNSSCCCCCCCWCCCCCCRYCCCTPIHNVQLASSSIRSACCDVHQHAQSRIMRMRLNPSSSSNCIEPTSNVATSIQHQSSNVAIAAARALAASNNRSSSSSSSRSNSAHWISTIWATCDNICCIQSPTSQCQFDNHHLTTSPGLMDSTGSAV